MEESLWKGASRINYFVDRGKKNTGEEWKIKTNQDSGKMYK